MPRPGPFALLLWALLLAGCAGQPAPESGGRVNHLVLCWLKEPGNSEHRLRIIEQTQAFRAIPGVLEVRVGEVVPSQRAIVDSSFDVGILLSFANAERMRSYIQHPAHQRAVREVLQPLVSRILVYDFIEP